MVAEAEVTGPNIIRLDTQNVTALTLSPGAGLIDSTKPLKVVWNGESRVLAFEGGRLVAQVEGQQALELIPVSETEFFVVEGFVQITFIKDTSGKTTAFKGWENGREFMVKKTE
jgi:hypothetical protein